MQRSWMLLGSLALASCAQFSGTPAPSDSAATTSKKSSASSTASTQNPAEAPTTTPSPSATFDPTQTTAPTSLDPLWPVSDGSASIPVCFEQGFSQSQRSNVKNAAQFWEATTVISFIGWLTCAPSDMSVHISALTDGSPSHVEQAGVEAVGTHVFINTMQDDNSVQSDVLHELGHIIGLGHEELSNAGDRAACDSVISTKGITDDLPVTVPADRGIDDHDSIMSRCRDTTDAFPSSEDLTVVMRLYGVSLDGDD